jgi:hypothetical protein
LKFSSNTNKIGDIIMEFTFTFAEIINKTVDLSLLGMESFIGIWLCAAFLASAYPDFSSLPTEPIATTPTPDPISLPTTPIATAPVPETTPIEPIPDITTTVTKLSYKSLRKLLSTLEVKYSGMNKESMITTLLSKITEEELDINSLLAAA